MLAASQAGPVLEQRVAEVAGTTVTWGGLVRGALVVAAGILLSVAADWVARSLIRLRGRSRGVQVAVGKLARYLVVFLSVVTALNVIGFEVTALIAASSALLLGIGFGLKNVTQNFIAGLIVLAEQPIRQGDFIEVNQIEGTVREVGLRASRIETRDGATLIVPNGKLITEYVTNYSYPVSRQRWTIRVHLSFDCDTAQVRALLEEVARAHPLVLAEPAPEARLEEFAASSFAFSVRFWVRDPVQSRRVAAQLRLALVEAFSRANIRFPLPQLELHPGEASPLGSR